MNAPFTAAERLTRFEVFGEIVADQLDWRRRPEVAAILTSLRANPPKSLTQYDRHATGTDEIVTYEGAKVGALRCLYEREAHVAMEACDRGDKRPWRALQNCDPMHRDGPRSVPSYLWLSSPVDRIIYDALQGEVA